MKKFLAIFTIVAMLSGMCTIGASAAVTDYALDASLELVEPTATVFTEDFTSGAWAQNRNNAYYRVNPSDFNKSGSLGCAFSSADDYAGVFTAGGGNDNGLPYHRQTWYVSGEAGFEQGYLSGTYGFCLRVPDFFKDKPAGQYTIKFDYYDTAGTDRTPMEMGVIDVGATVNNLNAATTVTWQEQPQNVVEDWTRRNEWVTVTKTFNYDGSVTPITIDGASAYDANMLVLWFGRDSDNRCKIDNFEIVSPGTRDAAVKATNTITADGSAADAVLINALYDEDGNLASVATEDITSSDTEVELAIPYSEEITSEWTFKGFIWADLDNTIEPLAETEEISLSTIVEEDPSYVFTFEDWNWTGRLQDKAIYTFNPANAAEYPFVALKANNYTGVLYGQGAGTYSMLSGAGQDNAWKQSIETMTGIGGNTATVAKTMGFSIAIPEFFKDKPAGNYTISIKYYDEAPSNQGNCMRTNILNVGSTVNGGAPDYTICREKATEHTPVQTWTTYTGTFNYSGNVTQITGENAGLYDPYMLCLFVDCNRNTSSSTCYYYYIESITITPPGAN